MMRRGAATGPALVSRLLGYLVGPMALVAVVLGIGGAWAITAAVRTVNDRLLGASARAIAETLAIEDGEITLDLTPSMLGMLENPSRDNIYYSVRHAGQTVTGYPDLPQIAVPPDAATTVFGQVTYRHRTVRIAAEARRLPRLPGRVIVEVAETMEARNAMARRMLIGLAVLEAALVGIALILVPVAVRLGLAPLIRLRAQVEGRGPSDFAPLPLADVPAEMADLVRTFNALLARLNAAVENVRRFTADASHQMRTPLSILRTHLAVLTEGNLEPEEARASLVDIDVATERLQHLLTQLLALARAEGASSGVPPLGPTDLVAVARQAATDLAPIAVRRHVDLQFDVSGTPAAIRSHALLAGELIGNLVDNAIRYNRPGGTVRVGVVGSAQRVVVRIEDNGPGIPAADRVRLFDRFSRLDRDPQRSGSGLGLSIAKALADALGATIEIADGLEGKGLGVTVAFPVLAAS